MFSGNNFLKHLEFYSFKLISCQVAARVTPRNADKDEWFVVKVIHFDKESKE